MLPDDLRRSFHELRVEGTKTGLVVSFTRPHLTELDCLMGIGNELMTALDLASRIDMPLHLSFQGVQCMSSAMIGKLVLLNKRAQSQGVVWSMRDMSPHVRDVFRRLFGGPWHLPFDG